MGWKNYLSCEIADFPNKILEHYWPDAYHHRDVKTLNYETINNELSERFGKQWRDDDIILTGGFPCQPYSSAGKRLGKEDERHLWPEMLRIISEIKPKFIVGENVFGLLNWNGGMVFAEVCSDLEHQGYEITPVVIPAAAVNAPHGRDRVWFVAYANGTGEKHNGGTNIAEEREVRGNEESNVLGELCGDGNATDTNSNGQFKGWRYDGSSQNDERSNASEQRSADTKDANGCSSDGILEKKSKTCRGISKQTNVKKNQTSSSSGICGMDEANNTEKIIGNNQFAIDKSRALVSQGLKGIFTSTNRRLEHNQMSFRELATMGLSVDISRINRMEGNATDTDFESLYVKKSIIEHTNVQRQKRRMYQEQPKTTIREQFSERNARSTKSTNWHNFPTQPPICSGNDGFSNRLDGITFSKWRAESIKGYGNAICPQVTFEIFKAIEKTYFDFQK
jgi:DNA (cytosine-5)-methyltransferase 1